MIRKTEPSSDSTQLIQLALDNILQTLSQATHLPLARLQRSLAYEKSPIRNVFQSLQATLASEKKFQNCFDQFNNYRTQLTESRQALDEAFAHIDLETDCKNKALYDSQLAKQTALLKQIEQYEHKVLRIYSKFKTLNKIRIAQIKQYCHKYSKARESLKQLLTDSGYSKFSEENINNTLAYLSHIQDPPGSTALHPADAPLHVQLGLVSKSEPIEKAIYEACHGE